MPEQLGLRARKKLETRRRIQREALRLFADRGFEKVTVAEVADAADVSQATVFNYFDTKEDLVLDGMSAYGHSLVAALAARPPTTSVLDAFRSHLLEPRGILADDDPGAMDDLVRVRGMIAASPALQAREHLIADGIATELAGLFADDRADGVRPFFLATAVVGVTRAITREVHRLALEGLPGTAIAAIVLPQGAAAVDILSRGLSDQASP
ncbi:TetR/AcrR family transcriptional regulator [Tsukamurella ocularis]|uniref:TetR/AcrR family transcriptional regulator n=1 Tax=Tsukamurella ocularis TaxID=1970234 RepID=UPI0039F0101C